MDGSSNSDDPLDVGWRDRPPNSASFFGLVRRQAVVLALPIVAAVIVALVIIVLAQPTYTARVSLYLDTNGATDPRGEEATAIDLATHSELIDSDATAATVIENLNLARRPEFAPQPSALNEVVDGLRALAAFAQIELEPVDPLTAVIRNVRTALTVARKGETRLIEVRFTSGSPALAAQIANAFARAHIANISARDQRATAQRITRLQDRAEETRRKAAEADARTRAILRQPGRSAASPQEIEQQIFALRQQLSAIESKGAALATKLSLIVAYERSGDVDDIAIDTPETRRLLSEFVGAIDRLAEIRQRKDIAPQVVATIEQGIDNLRMSLSQEVRLAARAIEIELEMTTAERNSISEQITRLSDYIASDSWAELEAARRDKIFYDGLYQDYLNRLEGVRREPRSQSELHIVTDALPPIIPSSPQNKVALAIAITLGAFIGIGLAALREWNRHEGSTFNATGRKAAGDLTTEAR